ncbi:MAG: AzlC family ABC transporter permease [Clostridia bacterium]|nr:AzlC family ABC transporter permease [Clostridia bacterium]
MTERKRKAFRAGLRDGVPIGLGYLAASFGLGIAARNAGLLPLESMLASMLNNASAGEYVGFTLIAAKATLIEIALMTFVANARYLLMSCAWSQRMAPDLPLRHRLLMGFFITDEFFATAIAQPGDLEPMYTYGEICVASPLWALGTLLGCIAGNLLPDRAVSAFSVALFGMFLATIIPAARKSRIIAGLVAVCFAASWAASALPLFAGISTGTRTIVLTVVIACAAALLFPIKDEEGEADA